MHKIFILLLTIASISLAGNTFGQSNRKSNEKEVRFADRLWYGGNVALEYGSNNYQSYFLFGVLPMVGYKITKDLSAGPRASIIYTNVRTQVSPSNVEKDNFVDWSIGAFARYKILNQFFIHGETSYSSVSTSGAFGTNQSNGREDIYLGAGYTSGGIGQFGGEIMVLYNFSVPTTSVELPISVQFGFNYNF